MRRTDHDHVKGIAHRLMGLRSPSCGRPEPHARPSAAVTARLALVWAAVEDPALMAGAIPQKSAVRVTEAKQLVSYGIEAWPKLDLLGNVALPLRCNRLLHSLQLGADDVFRARSHPTLDLEAERIAVAFGGDVLPCVAEMDASLAPCPPVTAPQVQSGPLPTSEHFRFVRLCRTWLAAGYSLDETGLALDEGLPWADLAGHLAAGLAVEVAMAWRSVEPAEAARWASLGYTLTDRVVWTGQGRSFEDARAATSTGGLRVTRWAQVAGSEIAASVLGEWAAWGEPTGVWGELARSGLRVGDVPGWLAAFTPVEVLGYVRLSVPLDEALRWKERGYTAFAAAGFIVQGISIEEAWELRGFPARQVQELWPRTGSVAAVFAELA